MCLYPIRLKGTYVACGKCMECIAQKSNEWAYRCMLEASLYKDNCMITLTYNEANCPKGNRLVKQDLQKFIKRLRFSLGDNKIRYFACGEYGSKHGRPHYHIIIFGWKPSDLFYFCKDNKGSSLFRSPLVEKEWKFGFSSVCDVEFDTCKYVAIYLQKKTDLSNDRPPPFILKSQGLGFSAFKTDWLNTDKIYLNGKYIRIPRYFIERSLKENPFLINNVEALKEKRQQTMSEYSVVVDNVELFYSNKYEDFVSKRREKWKKIFKFDFFKKK